METQLEFNLLDTDKYIYKSNNLIESSYNLSLNEQRLIFMAIRKLKPIYVKSSIKPSQMKTLGATQEFGDLRIYVNEFKKEFGLSGNSHYERLASITETLFDNKIQYLEDDGTFVDKRWVITCKYNNNEKYISMTFHPELILDLLVFKSKFGELKYDSSKKFKTNYAFRLYEILKNSAYKGIRRIEVPDLRHKLAMYEDSKYEKFGEFDRNVIKPAIKSINDDTDISVTYETIRYGRVVGAIEFSIEKKSCAMASRYDEEQVELSHYNNIKNILGMEVTSGRVNKITNAIIEAIREHKIDMTVYEYLQSKVDIVEQYMKTTTVKSYMGVLLTAISENWLLESKDKKLQFNNFEARCYDYDYMEEVALGNVEYDESKLYK